MIQWHAIAAGTFANRTCEFKFPDGVSLQWLKKQASLAPLRRARWCAHASPSDPLQEMLVAVQKGSFLPAHRHLRKPESLLVVEGLAALVLFDGEGNKVERHLLGTSESERLFFFRIPPCVFHCLEIETDYFVFHEITLGPYDPEETQVAPWQRGKDA